MPNSGVRISSRIGRADGGDRVRRLQPGLQEADAAVIFDAVDRAGLGGRPSCVEDVAARTGPGRRCCGRHHRVFGAGSARNADRRAPVAACQSCAWRMSNGRSPSTAPAGEVGGGAAQRGEAAPIVGPVLAVAVGVGIARRGRRAAARRARAVGCRRARAAQAAAPGRRADRASRATVRPPGRAAPAPPDSRAAACASRRHAARARPAARPTTSARPPGLDQRIGFGGDRRGTFTIIEAQAQPR